MIKRIFTTIIATLVLCSLLTMAAQAASLSPTLKSKLAGLTDATSAGLVIISFKTSDGLKASHLDQLRSLGIKGGYTFQNLGMVGAVLTVAQVKSLSTNPNVRSIWSNDRLEYFMEQAQGDGGRGQGSQGCCHDQC